MVEANQNVNAFAGKAETKKAIWHVAVHDVGCYIPAQQLVTIVSSPGAHTIMLVLPKVTLFGREKARKAGPGEEDRSAPLHWPHLQELLGSHRC